MNSNILANLFLAQLSPVAGSFIVMTSISVMLLWIIPHTHRYRIRKVGAYHHEICHGLASLATGGEFHRFHVDPDGNGMCVTSGGNQKIITSAGYIGTILLGTIFLAESANSTSVVIALQVIAVLLAFSTIKAGDLHTAAVGVLVATFLGLFSTLFPNTILTRFLMNLMGVVLIWQGVEALKVLIKLSATTENTGSDAEAMAAMTGKKPLHWALVFSGIAFVIILALFNFII